MKMHYQPTGSRVLPNCFLYVSVLKKGVYTGHDTGTVGRSPTVKVGQKGLIWSRDKPTNTGQAPPSTVVPWAGKIDKLRETDRQGKSTLGGSDHKAETLVYEDLLTMRVNDLRRERYIATGVMIIFMAQEIAPQFFENKTINAALGWLVRNRLTLRRVTTHGRESREDMIVRKAEFCDEVRRVIADSVVSLNAGLDPRSKVFNMDIFASTTAYTTVEQVGVRVVPALTAGSDSQRITIALLVRADGLVLPPHFVFKGQPDGEVERQGDARVD
ncbi:hypothetical protein PF005_g8391 [Phytophthora fragariae]|uniref:Uncharacterized protein n=1 Tax=Phytophthora fragariae TaxID=53985 RepID=A0A6A3YFT7_9STRA|nr:hypothetical protein PF005_g8391 [Phytophthora fragariae]KAE9247678.1 hypothetical protein PF002_g6158 [Phytophthora fragariae]